MKSNYSESRAKRMLKKSKIYHGKYNDQNQSKLNCTSFFSLFSEQNFDSIHFICFNIRWKWGAFELFLSFMFVLKYNQFCFLFHFLYSRFACKTFHRKSNKVCVLRSSVRRSVSCFAFLVKIKAIIFTAHYFNLVASVRCRVHWHHKKQSHTMHTQR